MFSWLLVVGDMTKIKAKGGSSKKKDEKEKEGNVDTKISNEIQQLNGKILKLNNFTSSMDALLPDCKYKCYDHM